MDGESFSLNELAQSAKATGDSGVVGSAFVGLITSVLEMRGPNDPHRGEPRIVYVVARQTYVLAPLHSSTPQPYTERTDM